nr:PTS sugar transporter subunit IIA [Pisciglobus halotolerans]
MEQVLKPYDPDNELLDNLALHMRASINRMKENISIRNAYKNEIRKAFIQSYEISKDFVSQISKIYHVKFTSDEISYIALHIQSFLERKRNRKVNVLLVCASGLGTSKLLKQRIKFAFGDTIQIDNVLGINELNSTHADRLIISTIPIKDKRFKSITVSPIISEKDLRKIDDYVLPRNKGKAFVNLTNEKNFFISYSDDQNQNDVLKLITDNLVYYEQAKKGIYESAIQREELSSTVLDHYVAMPHSTIEFIKRPSISIFINANGINWNGEKVKIIFFFGINQEVLDNLDDIYKYFNDLISNRLILNRITKVSSYQELIDILKEL